MATKSKIHIKPSKRGSLRKAMGAKKGDKLSVSEMKKKMKNASPAMRKKLNFAINARKWKHEDGGILPMLEWGGDPTSLVNLGSSFAEMNNLSQPNELVGTNNPGGKKGGLKMSFDPISMGLQALTAITGSIGENMAMKRNELYEDAGEQMRQVDVNQVTKGAGLQSFLQNPLSFGIGGRKKARLEAEEFNENITKQQRNRDVASRFSTMSQAPTYSPVARQGGFIAYKGQKHEGPDGGILVDKFGNPTAVSQGESIASVEGGGKNKKGEVSYYDPESGSTYIYSDALKFAKPANGLLNKYKLNKPESLQYMQYKNDLLTQTMVKKKFENLTTAQEFAKETDTDSKDAIGMFRKGGQLSTSKAKEMLRDGTAHGKKLTSKQKRYFGWVAGGMKEDGGELISVPDKRKIDMVTGQPLKDTHRMHSQVDSEYIKLIRDKAKEHGIDPYTALAINLQETRFEAGKNSNPFNYIKYTDPNFWNEGYDQVGESLKFMKQRFDIGKKRGKKTDEEIIQAFNGYGKVGNTNDLRSTKVYGIDVSKEPIDMNVNPVYGKRVVNLRDSVLKTNPKIRKIVDTYAMGGNLPKYQFGNDGDGNYLSPFEIPQVNIPAYQGILNSRSNPYGLSSVNINGNRTPYPGTRANNPIGLPQVDVRGYNGVRNSRSNPVGLPDVSVADTAPRQPFASKILPPTPKLNMPSGFANVSGLYDKKTSNAGPGYYNKGFTRPYSIGNMEPQGKQSINSGIPRGTFNSIEPYNAPNDLMQMPDYGSLASKQGVDNMNLPTNPVIAGQGINPFKQEETMGNTWLNPAGHLLSGAGMLADYFALKKAKPTNLSLGRVGAERISLAKQRLANTRNTAAARAMASTAARSSGMNSGVALSNTLAANTGANRLLGQQNAELLQNEENTNAQMRQQANMVNAELAAQEGMFNTQTQNAYRMMMAQRNPLGNMARTAASYFADNAAYQQGYDTMQMLAPNAELYRDPNAKWKKNPFARPKVRLRDKTL